MIREALVSAVINGLLVIPVFAAVRAVLRADLIDDLRPRRRPVTRTRVLSQS